MDRSAPQTPFPAAPQVTPTARPANRSWWVEGDRLFAHKGATLPDISLRSGLPATHRVRYKFSWAPPAVEQDRIFFPVLGLLAYLTTRSTAELDFALTKDEQRRHQVGRLFVLAAFVFLAVGVVAWAMNFAGAAVVGLLGIGAFVGLLISGIYRTGYATVARIDDQQLQLKLTPDAAAAFAAWSGR